MTAADFAKLATFGMNAVRLPIGCGVAPLVLWVTALLWSSSTALGLHVLSRQT